MIQRIANIISLFFVAALAALFPWCAAYGEQPDSEGIAYFERHIRPVLVTQCYECHADQPNRENVKGGLRLDTRAGTRQGGDTGAAVVPSDPAASLLLSAIRYEDFEMPPDGQLAPNVVAHFEKWIEMGAPDPRDGASNELANAEIDWQAAQRFWAFQQPTLHPLPTISQGDWPHRRIDWFALAKMDEHQLVPNPSADRRTLVRRAWLDTIGLPPTPEAVDRFVSDDSPDAYERLVDELLSSPHFGEHWARMWLDIARYAEDQAHIVGDNQSLFYPNAYLYRDWLISALNDNLPFDRFVRLQLAADFFEPDSHQHRAALGFIGLGPKYYARGMAEVKADEWEDRVDTVTRGLLGLTVACARCHDHKYDPIETEDYYALAGVFASTKMFNRPLDEKRETKNGEAKNASDAMHIIAEGTPTDLHVFVRGDIHSKGDLVRRRFLRILGGNDSAAFVTGSGRGELAEAILDPQNALTARVFVNRVWAAYFGSPLVSTPSNFGQLGGRPTHPELLDDLAVRFVESRWSIKWLHREILTSATYRQSSQIDAQHSRDPENRWLSRMNRKRMSIEQWRDTLLTVAGRRKTSLGGKSIDPDSPTETRRTVYSRISRFQLNSMLAMFDYPDPNVHSAGRSETTTPLQKLFVLNSPFMTRRAAELADSLVDGDTITGINTLYRQLMGRAPTLNELNLGQQYIRRCEPEDAWQQYAQVLLASNEMMFID